MRWQILTQRYQAKRRNALKPIEGRDVICARKIGTSTVEALLES